MIMTARASHPLISTTSTPAGTVDIYGTEMRQRQAVIDILREIYVLFGFDQLHTPILENAEVFRGHHGEGERLLFNLRDSNGNELVNRYDLTVPLARFAASHPEIPRPFKRYQIEPVFRDDKPDKGHFREFTQCDGDVIGDNNLTADAEVICMACFGLKRLGFSDFTIRVNHRDLIRAISHGANITDYAGVLDIQRALDFSDKITKNGIDGIHADLLRYGINESVADVITEMITIDGATELHKLEKIRNKITGFGQHENRGVDELVTILSMLPDEVIEHVSIDLTLSRGADYYTGFILEGVVHGVPVGAVLGGGRYDNLVGRFSGTPEPAVGMAFGLERIMVALKESDISLFFGDSKSTLVVQRDDLGLHNTMEMVAAMRSNGEPVVFVQSANLDAVSYAAAREIASIIEIIRGEARTL